jgi:type I restriction enzyme S subunit
MSISRYPQYKHTGYDWPPEIPRDWDLGRLKDKVRLVTKKPESDNNPVALENVEGWTGRLVETETAFEGDGIDFRRGDILFGKLRPYLAKVYLADSPGEAVGDFFVMRPDVAVCGRFLQYQMLTREFISIIESSTSGAKMPRASWDFLGTMPLACPGLPEQQAIAAFLDRETAKIDKLSVEQQRLIELLNEKRHAITTHAITRGLNPSESVRESGIEWLGDIPSHWKMERGRFLFRKLDLPPSPDDGVVTAFRDGQVTLRENRRTDGFTMAVLEVGYQKVRTGDLVIHGMDAFAGAIGVSESDGKCTPEYSVLAAARPPVNNDYFALILRLMAHRNYIYVICPSVRERAPRFRFESFKDVLLPVPPPDEQDAIVAFVVAECDKIDRLSSEAETAIFLLQERRAALISAAVTGRIDVRGIEVVKTTPRRTVAA